MIDIAFTRRSFAFGSLVLGGMVVAAPGSALAAAAGSKRLLFVLQRGAADGLATLAPTGDPDFARLRGPMLEDYEESLALGSFFRPHPAFANIGTMAAQNEVLFVHAVASAYRERSHFDAQNLLETGGLKAYARRDGWLNRLVGLLADDEPRALALSAAVPTALQGPQPVSSYAPSALPEASADLLQRIAMLYQGDEQLAPLLDEAVRTRAMAGEVDIRNLRNAEAAGQLAASLMSGPQGARIMMVESNGWDSHAGQQFQFPAAARRLDAMLGAFRERMGPEWQDTLVLVATEFGRTAALNGTRGTDHGTGAAMMVIGGGVRGGRVLSDWPGLREGDLYQSRDLMPTRSTESVLAGAIAEHFGLDSWRTMAELFPGRDAAAETGLLRV
ncbi:DUF1501 domain-containing protein [Parerythrobacter aestuarii]|uniref:DUF1501 domain-containing protein n=1 Tax=Parerythrobacter aestuarii TaxID=3020909 RepID=UPI0024DE48B9|nr:DUF1501 domain-containing protein [Parerythrobacter aestuarii]